MAGQRVALAEMAEQDQPYFLQWLAGNAQLRALIDDHGVPSMEDQMKWFKRIRQPDRKFFSLLADGNTLVGNAGFINIDPENNTAVFRITIGHPGYWGKGYGSDAIRLMLDYGFDKMDLKEIFLEVLESNPRAIRAYEKIGFKTIGKRIDGATGILKMAIEKSSFFS